ncbi:hypothetical protein ACFL6N_02410 [Thermodesulfobacteriota bacterium]
MTFRSIAFWVGLFSLVVGVFTYDSEVPTSPFPIVTGLFVILLAVTGLLPEFKRCVSCHKKILKKDTTCRFCGKNQTTDENDTSP